MKHPLQHATLALHGGGEQRAAVLLGQIEIDRGRLPHHKAVVVDGGQATIRIQRQIPRCLGAGVLGVDGDRHMLVGDVGFLAQPGDTKGA